MTGIFTTEQEAKLAQMLDDVVKLKGVAELVDGFLFKAIITFTDDTFAEKLPQELKDNLSALATACLEDNWTLAESLSADLLNDLIDIPVLNEETEGLIWKSVVGLLIGAVLKWVESKKAE